MSIRKNLMMSIDSRLTGEQEVLILKTTSTDNIVIQISAPKTDVHPEDLQRALDEIKQFLNERDKQPDTLVPVAASVANVTISEAPAIKSAFDENSGISKFENTKKQRKSKKKQSLDDFLPETNTEVAEESDLSQN